MFSVAMTREHKPADHIQQLTPNMLRVALEAGVPAERQSVVPLGLAMSTDWTPPSPDERARLRQGLGLPAERRVVLSVAALNDSQKRLGYLVDELAAMPEPRPFLAMLGQPDAETPSILARARDRLGEGNWLARTAAAAEMRDWYRAADVFVLSSDFDNSPNVVLEAMASGLPLVATNVGGVPDFVEAPAGGALVDKGDAAAMGTEILELLGNDARRRDAGSFNRQRATTKFSWRTSAEQLLSAYQRTMASRAA